MPTPNQGLPAVRHVSTATRDIIQIYLKGNAGSRIAERLAEENENFPPILAELQDPGSQISWGVTKKNGKFVVTILLAEEGGLAHKLAKDVEQAYEGVVSSQVIGSAHAWDPNKDFRAAAPVSEGVVCAGASISHHVGFPGTVGCIVRSGLLGENSLGF
jgi:hypothetical protein